MKINEIIRSVYENTLTEGGNKLKWVDVIDRMEAALETAARWYPCECCEYGFTDDYWKKRCPCYKNEEYEESGFRIADKLLTDEMED